MRKYEDKFNYIGEDETLKFVSESYPIWCITDFVKEIVRDDLRFVIQPLMKSGEVEGFTGLHCFVVDREIFERDFKEII